METAIAIKECGRGFSAREMEVIRTIIETARPALHARIAREVCEELDWRDAKGELKAMSCRVALLRMHRRGEITLPAPRNGNGNGKPLSRQKVILPQQPVREGSVEELTNLELVGVDSRSDSALCDASHY